jgi:hypothetical protein
MTKALIPSFCITHRVPGAKSVHQDYVRLLCMCVCFIQDMCHGASLVVEHIACPMEEHREQDTVGLQLWKVYSTQSLQMRKSRASKVYSSKSLQHPKSTAHIFGHRRPSEGPLGSHTPAKKKRTFGVSPNTHRYPSQNRK